VLEPGPRAAAGVTARRKENKSTRSESVSRGSTARTAATPQHDQRSVVSSQVVSSLISLSPRGDNFFEHARPPEGIRSYAARPGHRSSDVTGDDMSDLK
jgi:hypothetical protein